MALVPTGAAAHAFASGADLYAQFVEGAGVVAAYPATFLPLLALGLFLGLWSPEGMVRAWPVFLAGQIAGIGLAALAGPWILPVGLAAGIIVATLGALLPRGSAPLGLGLAGAIGALSLMTGLEGHGLFELPAMIHLGILFGVNVATALSAGLARLALERVAADWMRIALRIACSWIAAMLMLILAFTLRGPG